MGPLELLIVLAIVLLVFGARRLPSLGRELGSGMREFKDGLVNPGDEPTRDTPARTLPAADGTAVRDGRNS